VLGDGIDVVIRPPTRRWPRWMTSCGTCTRRRAARRTRLGHHAWRGEEMVLAYVREWVPEARKAPLGGNTVGTDRGFLARDMPELESTCTTGSSTSPRSRNCPAAGTPGPTSRPPPSPGAPGSGRHPRVDRRVALLPRGGLRAEAGALTDQARALAAATSSTTRRLDGSCPEAGPVRAPRRSRYDCRALRRQARSDAVAPPGGCSSAGRAPGCGPGCRGFKSRYSPHLARH
jgi:hypothetical protein